MHITEVNHQKEMQTLVFGSLSVKNVVLESRMQLSITGLHNCCCIGVQLCLNSAGLVCVERSQGHSENTGIM